MIITGYCINLKLSSFYIVLLISAMLMPATVTAADDYKIKLQVMFDEAKELQQKKDFSAAITHYEKLIADTPPADKEEIAFDIHADALLQLMYCHVFANRREDGALFFTQMRNTDKYWIVRYSPRDIEICNAYAIYEATRPEQAAALIDTTLTRPEEGRSPERLYVD